MFYKNCYILIYSQNIIHLSNLYTFFFFDNYFNNLFKLLEILPEFSLFILILINLINLLYSNAKNEYNKWFIFFVFLLVLYLYKFSIYICVYNGIYVLFNFCWISTIFILMAKILILFAVVFYFITINFSIQKCNKHVLIEFCWLIGISLFFIFALLNSYNFFFAYINIEGLSLILYIIASCINNNFISKESSFKYLALSSIASGLLLIGIIWFFTAINSLNFNTLGYYFLEVNYNNTFELHMQLAIILIFIAFLFKIGAFPCYYWIPDVYVGIWTPITFYFSTIIKLSLFLFFFKFTYNVNYNVFFFWKNLLLFASIGSILTGALGASYQINFKKFIAYASVNQTGFILLGLTTGNIYGLKASLIFIIVYTIMNIVFFSIILNTINLITGRNIYYINDLTGLAYYNPISCLIFISCIFSMAGIPPYAGFFSKFYIFFSFVKMNCFLLNNNIQNYNLFVILLLSLISSFYYINIIKQLFFEKNNINTFFWFIYNTKLKILLGINIFILTFWLFFFNPISYFFELMTISCIAPFTCAFVFVY